MANLIARNIRVKGEFRFTSRLPNPPYPAWMGIMLRSQGYLASSGHLALLRAKGVVAHTQQVPEANGIRHEDMDIGRLDGFDPAHDVFVPLDIAFDEVAWRIIGNVAYTKKISEIRTCFLRVEL